MENSTNTKAAPLFFDASGWASLKENLLTAHAKCFVLTDTHTQEFCLPVLKRQLTEINFQEITIPAGEHYKTIDTCKDVWQTLTDLGATRQSILLCLGGGVVTDLGGFVASTFKRGMAFYHIPTSLLAMVDAAIGGKTGVDFNGLKNQIGVIQSPEGVLIDPSFLNTLPERELNAGWAEMLKHGLINSQSYWTQVKNFPNKDNLSALIKKSVQIKQEVVALDPFEKGHRKILNFGHTIGHAIESYGLQPNNFPVLLHGEAVAIGLLIECIISAQKLNLPNTTTHAVYACINKYFELPRFTDEAITYMLGTMQHDKKNFDARIQAVLLQEIGKPIYNQTLSASDIRNAIEVYHKLYADN